MSCQQLKETTLVTVIPVGPTWKLDFVLDTIESVVHYITSPNVVIVLDDSGKGSGSAVQTRFPEVVVLPTDRNYGKDAGLYLNLSRGFAFAYDWAMWIEPVHVTAVTLCSGRDGFPRTQSTRGAQDARVFLPGRALRRAQRPASEPA